MVNLLPQHRDDLSADADRALAYLTRREMETLPEAESDEPG
jgi:hypothetical protein